VALLQGLALGAVTRFAIRTATAGDLGFIERMLCWAGAWRSTQLDESVLDEPGVSRYAEGWGRQGDFGLIAETQAGEPVGAAWYRLFRATDGSYGFVGEDVPEVTIGVEPSHRGAGVGGALLEGLAGSAREAGFPALSLSVEEDNPALRLYERLGFERQSHSDGAWTLVLTLG
jgi:ribosomal protein S18 acetylase RimI-like enzyme